MIPDEDEVYDKHPTLEVVKENLYRGIICITDIILNANKYEEAVLNEYEIKKHICGLDPLIDKILAINIADILSKQEYYESNEKFIEVWLDSIEGIKTDFMNSNEDNKCSVVQQPFKIGIDTSKLTIGMTVKNYKVLCELLGEPVLFGNSRKAQLNTFKCYFDWEKSGQKFIITDIYDTPLTKEDKRRLGNNSIYVQCIEVILLQYLSKQEGYTRTFTKRNWWEMLGIVNHKYGRTSEKQLKDLDYTVTAWEVRHFYQRCNKKLEQILFSALNSLKNRKLITYEIQTVIVQTDKRGNQEYFEADDCQKKQILEIERHVLHNIMGYEKMFQVFINFQQVEFYQKVNDLLYEKYGWHYYFKQIKVIYTPEGIKEALPKLEIKLQRELLNKKVVDYLNTNAKEIYENNKASYQQQVRNLINEYWGEKSSITEPKSGKMWNPPDTYLTAQSILTDELIKIGHKDMTFSIQDFIESNSDIDELFAFDK